MVINMFVKEIRDEDFTSYKKPSMTIGFPNCSWKCGRGLCQNSSLAKAQSIYIDVDVLTKRYIDNPITHAVICAGLEPFDNFDDLLRLVAALRTYTTDDIVIYSGYTEYELENGWFYMENRNSNTRKMAYEFLKTYPNIIIKFGRFIPNQQPHYDEVLGVKLASYNQYARRIS